MIRICENCKKNIKSKEHYFEVNEFKDGKKIGVKFVHKSCQDNYDNQLKQNLQVNKQASEFINNANNFMEQMGMKKVVTI